MKIAPVWVVLLLLFCFQGLGAESQIPYGTGTWDAELYGNHRALIQVPVKADAVLVRIPWRRRDRSPESKNIIILDAATQRRVRNLCRLSINREYGDLVFQPISGPGLYFAYYLISRREGRSNYPQVTYPGPEETADGSWLERNDLTEKSIRQNLRSCFPEGRVAQFQSIDELHSFFPMEVIATSQETQSLVSGYTTSDFLLFPEDRRYPIRMTRDLPRRWIIRGPGGSLQGRAARGEFYAFQLGVYAFRKQLDEIRVHFSDLRHISGNGHIVSQRFTCFNLEGVDWKGKEFSKSVSVPSGQVQALWCGVSVPRDIQPGSYRGHVRVSSRNTEGSSVGIRLEVKSECLSDAGDSEPWRHSRLRWLNSRVALDEKIVAPYRPLEVEGYQIRCLGRSVLLNDLGFPQQISSFFTPEMTGIGVQAQSLLSGPIRLVLSDSRGRELVWKSGGFRYDRRTPGLVEWSCRASAGPLEMEYRARMEIEGFLDFQVRLLARESLSLSDIALLIPFRKEAVRYMLGMGVKGGRLPLDFVWGWDPQHNQDSVWLGNVNAGLQLSLRDHRYSRPLNTNFYLLKPLVMPDSWCNGGKGGCSIREEEDKNVSMRAYSGPRRLEAGETQHYYFSLLITPFRPLDTSKQWATRFYHRFAPIPKIDQAGANTINVHHATEINPFINYPFLRSQAMKEYIDSAHQQDMKVKIYYTVRELSNRAPELHALRSLGEEIFFPGTGGGFSWLQEHLEPDYIAGWFVPDYQDAAIINSGASRWHNYYLEGLNWLVQNVGIDGLYIDDVAFDRIVMKRVRKILNRHRPGALIDLHSANQFNPRDGFANSSNLYLEHFPFIDRLWFGEYFDYDSPPDYWLVEVSGIPFGLMGEMLQDGGNPWRGMLYGMTARLPWAGDPRELWKLWDSFGIQETAMIGYWSPNCPVKTGREDILATVYLKRESALLALGSWAAAKSCVRLEIDWVTLGLDPMATRIYAPYIPGFQEQAEFKPSESIPVDAGKGWLLVLTKQDRF